MNYDNLSKERIISIHKDTLKCVERQQKEIERLNNIINKAVEYIEEHTENIDRGRYYEDYVETYPILQILKGVDKE